MKLFWLFLLTLVSSSSFASEDNTKNVRLLASSLVQSGTAVDVNNRQLSFLSPDYRLQSREAFVRTDICVDPNEPDCDDAIFFSDEAVLPPNGFRFQSTGPDALKGVFWLQASGDRASILTSFAETRSGGGVDTGVLEENFEGMVYVKRPVSDQAWAFGFGEETDGFSFANLGAFIDGVYRFQLRGGELQGNESFLMGSFADPHLFACWVHSLCFSKIGTLDAPEEFRVYPELIILPLSDCVHFQPWNFIYDCTSPTDSL